MKLMAKASVWAFPTFSESQSEQLKCEVIRNVSSLTKCMEKLKVVDLGSAVVSPCFMFPPATYLEVLEAYVFLPEPEVRISNKSHNSSD